nr:hypothetical protein [Candidatus Njordarchaeota archaeon]
MTVDEATAEKNLKEFLEKRGRKGFLQLLLKNYLYELLMYYLHSGSSKPSVKEDTGFEFYVDRTGHAYTASQIEKFKKDLEAECLREAGEIIGEIERLEIIRKWDEGLLTDPAVTKLIQEAFEKIMKSIRG